MDTQTLLPVQNARISVVSRLCGSSLASSITKTIELHLSPIAIDTLLTPFHPSVKGKLVMTNQQKQVMYMLEHMFACWWWLLWLEMCCIMLLFFILIILQLAKHSFQGTVCPPEYTNTSHQLYPTRLDGIAARPVKGRRHLVTGHQLVVFNGTCLHCTQATAMLFTQCAHVTFPRCQWWASANMVES